MRASEDYRVEQQGTEWVIMRGHRCIVMGLTSGNQAMVTAKCMRRAYRHGWEDRKKRMAVMPPLVRPRDRG